MSSRAAVLVAIACFASSAACQIYDPELLQGTAPDFELDASMPSLDSSQPGNLDSGPLPVDAGMNSNPRPPDSGAPNDAAVDAGALDASMDAGMDASPDSGANADGGGAADSGVDAGPVDECPNDPDKTGPGACGCGIPENCTGLIAALRHRYSFDGTGGTITDSKGTAHGTSGTALTGNGALALTGASTSFATLPEGLVSVSPATTIEFWMTWSGGDAEQRPISFGTSTPTKPSNLCVGSADFFRGSWYHFCGKDGTMSWSKARGLCEGAGGFLASIESADEDQFIDSHPAFTESVWIGANDQQTEGQWYFANASGLQGGLHFWSGGANGSAVNGAFEDWRTDEAHPDNSAANLDCSFIFKPTSTWTAFGCEFDGSFVCEWRGHRGNTMNRGLWFTPSNDGGRPSLNFQTGTNTVSAQAANTFPTAAQAHVALVLEPTENRIQLYVDGALAASAATSDALSNLRDADNWLGRSHLSSDPGFTGSIAELRVYDRALNAQEIQTSRSAGPDPVFLEPD